MSNIETWYFTNRVFCMNKLTIAVYECIFVCEWWSMMWKSALFETLFCRFHYFIFDEVLDVAKKFTVFDGTANAMYVVPVKSDDGGFDVDWECLQTSYSIPLLTEPTFDVSKFFDKDNSIYIIHVPLCWALRRFSPYYIEHRFLLTSAR